MSLRHRKLLMGRSKNPEKNACNPPVAIYTRLGAKKYVHLGLVARKLASFHIWLYCGGIATSIRVYHHMAASLSISYFRVYRDTGSAGCRTRSPELGYRPRLTGDPGGYGFA